MLFQKMSAEKAAYGVLHDVGDHARPQAAPPVGQESK